jgi:putative phosphoesterase
MRVAILSDIHGNIDALRAVLKEAALLKVERLIVLGDFVGYYYSPALVLDALRSWPLHAIKGNHEVMLAAAVNEPERLSVCTEKYGSGLAAAVTGMRTEDLKFLVQLPETLNLEIGGQRFYFCHGAPWDMNVYVYPDSPPELLERCRMEGIDNLVMGHTHYPMVMRSGDCLILNPGSVGQSRDVGGLASWLLFDAGNGVFSHRRTPYATKDLINEVKRRDPHLPKLWEILCRGQGEVQN